MTRPAFDGWEAQSPSEGFADRAVAAVLLERAAAPRPRRSIARPWVLLAAAACVLVAGAAWGWTVVPRGAAPVDVGSPVVPIERTDPAPSAAQGRSLQVVPALVEAAPARPVPARVKPVAPAPSARSPVVPPPVLPTVPNPPCNCNAFACECGPE